MGLLTGFLGMLRMDVEVIMDCEFDIQTGTK